MKNRKRALSAITAIIMAMTLANVFAPAAVAETPTLYANSGIQKEFYVSEDGSDANDGSSVAPFATVERARQAVDAINDNMTGDIVVNIAPGDYFMDKTIRMTKNDSGTNGYEVIYRGLDQPGSARLIGGKKLTGEWTPADESDVTEFDMDSSVLGNVYKLKLSEDTPDFNTLYINGRRATMARTLNHEENERLPTAGDTYMYATGGSAYSINYPGELPKSAVDGIKNALSRGEEGAQVHGWDWDYRNWFTSTIPVVGVNGTSLQFKQDAKNPAANRPKYPFGGGARFYLQGNLAFLDVPGEYHYNKKENMLYYYPKAGENTLEEQEIIIPLVQEIFHLEGDEKAIYASEPKPENQVHNITFEGLEAGYTEFASSYSYGWNAFDALGIGVYPAEALQKGITQPSYCEQTERAEFRKGVFTLSQTNNITLDSMRIVNSGLMGLNAWGDNDHITVQNSEFGYLGFHGINIDGGYPGPDTGKYSYGHLVTNNVIHDIGELVGHGTGIQALQLHDSEFSHLEIYHSPRRAIFLEGAWANRTAQDSGFVRYRDAHTYNNHFEYLYLHDLQQDGGDDGAFFICTLYGSWGDTSGDKPNYINQLYMNNVGASASTHDFKPNCMNLDMGCDGMVVSNMKAVNPQHYNVIWGGKVTFDNVNNSYYSSYSDQNAREFDESKMEYDEIGVNAAFPYPEAVYELTPKNDADYQDLYYREEFDNGLNDWWNMKGKPSTSSLYYSDTDAFGPDNNSFLADAFYGANSSSDGCRIGKPFGSDLNKVVEIDFFDHMCDGMENGYCGMSFQWQLNSFARVDDGNAQRAIGVSQDISGQYYSYKIGDFARPSHVKREYGWHTFTWDYTSGTDVEMYIDGQQIANTPADSFSYIEMGSYNNGFNAYDNVVIYGGNPAPAPIPLPDPPTPEEPEEGEGKILPGKLEAEEAKLPDGVHIDNIAGGGKAVTYTPATGVYEFSATATEAFELPLTVRYASNNAQAAFDIQVDDGQSVRVTLSPSKGWDTYLELTTKESFSVDPGEHTIKLTIVNNNFNLDYIGFFAEDAEEPIDPVGVTSIVPSVKDTLMLSVGNSIKVPVQVLPANADNKAVTWSTDDTAGSVITVAEDGTITAKGIGTATVTVTSVSTPGVAATISVEVQNAEASLISTTAKGCKPSANSTDGGATPDKLIDGDLKKTWNGLNAKNGGGRSDPSCYLEWETPQNVKSIYLYDVPEGGNYVEKMEIIFNGDPSSKVVLENGVPDGDMAKVILPETLTDVKKIEFHILKGSDCPYMNYGFAEIKVFSESPGEVPVNSVSFGTSGSGVTLFPGNSYTLQPPTVVPSTATNSRLTVTLQSGEGVITLTPYAPDGFARYYTIAAVKVGEAVVRATAANGVYADFKVTVGDKELLGNKIVEAEALYGKYPGESPERTAFRKVIDQAIGVYSTSKEQEQHAAMLEKLIQAMTAFETASTPAETAQSVADMLTLTNPSKGDKMLSKPAVAFGFKLSLTANPADIILSNWAINTPDEDKDVTVTLKVTKIADGSTGTKLVTLKVLGESAQDIANTLALTAPNKGETLLAKPVVPYGYDLAIAAANPAGVILDNWSIQIPDTDVAVEVTLRVTKKWNQSTGTKKITVAVPGQSAQDVLDTLEIPQPVKKETKLKFPALPNGFKVTVVSSTENIIAEDGTITPQTQSKEVTATIRVTKTIDGNYAERAFTFNIPGLLKPLDEAIEAKDIDAVSGSAIKIDYVKNEVLNFNGGDTIRYDYVDFGEEEKLVQANINLAVHPNWAGKKIHFKLDSADGETIGTVTVQANPVGGDWGVYYMHTLRLNQPLSGVHSVYLLGEGGEGIGGVKELAFTELPSNAITVSGSIINGTVTANQAIAAEGDMITLNIIPDSGYRLKAGSLQANGGKVKIAADNTFAMPGEAVAVTAEFEKLPPDVYAVSIAAMEHGKVTANPTSATQGETVTLTIAPEKGYRLKAGSLKANGGKVKIAADNTFVMPGESVVITAKFEKSPSNVYAVSIATMEHGRVTANPTSAAPGETVTLTIAPQKGYQLKEGSLKANGGKVKIAADNTFIMPSEAVTIAAVFEISESPIDPGLVDKVKDTIKKLPNPQSGKLTEVEAVQVGAAVDEILSLDFDGCMELSASEIRKMDDLLKLLGVETELADPAKLLNATGLALSAGTTSDSVKVTLVVNAVESDIEHSLLALDMSYMGPTSQPQFPIRFEMKRPKEWRGKEIELLHIKDDAGTEKIKVEQDGDTIIFWAQSFSKYVFVETNVKPVTPTNAGNAGHTIDVLITVEAGPGGKVSPEKFIAADFGDDVTLTVTPDEGYEVDKVAVDGRDVSLTDRTYTFADVIDHHTFQVAFRLIEVKAEADEQKNPDATSNPKTGVGGGELPFAMVLVTLAGGAVLLRRKPEGE